MRLAALVALAYLGGCYAYGLGHRAGCRKTENDFANHLSVIGV